jgi:hypothetical protein
MHPHQLGSLATQHIAELHEGATARHRADRAAAVRPRVPVRRRAGWALVHVGLRLAASSADT